MAEPIGENISRVFQDLSNTIRSIYYYLGKNQAMNNQALVENQTSDYSVVLGFDNRPGFITKTKRVVISGVPGTIMDKQVVVEGSAIIRNMTLICDRNIPALLVKETGRCVLENCHIVKSDGLQGAADSFVVVENAGLLNVVGCMFHGVQAAGYVISSAALAPVTNVDVTGCVNITGIGHANVTTVGEVP